jgi:hypothetical protein
MVYAPDLSTEEGRDVLSPNQAFFFAGLILFGLSAAGAQQREAVSTACNNASRGAVNCPDYTAPAATAVPGKSLDGSMNVPGNTSTTLFGGAVPPNAFMVRAYSTSCFVNDNGAASGVGIVVGGVGNPAGFYMIGDSGPTVTSTFITPPGYKPMGPVSVWCNGPTPTYVAARGW